MKNDLKKLRFFTAEYMAKAVLDFFPEAQLLNCTVTDIGFEYDFVIPQNVEELFLRSFEEKTLQLIDAKEDVREMEMMRKNAVSFFEHHGQDLKAEIIEDMPDQTVKVLKIGDFHDLCLVDIEGYVLKKPALKLFEIQKIDDVTRISGTCFPDKRELKDFFKAREQVLESRKLISQYIAPGSVWLPSGAGLAETILNAFNPGFQKIITPKKGSAEVVFRVLPSGIYQDQDLNVYGLLDPGNLEQTLISYLQFIEKSVKLFDLKFRWILAYQRPKSFGFAEEWDKSVARLTKALQKGEIQFEGDPERALTHGPMIEMRLIDGLGQEWPGPSVSVDLHDQRKLKIQASALMGSMIGSLERFGALVIERYAGQFPFWLAPEQIRVISVPGIDAGYIENLRSRCLQEGYRTGLDTSSEKLGTKIHAAAKNNVPFVVIIGDKEHNNGLLTVRNMREDRETGSLTLDALFQMLQTYNLK